MNAIVILTIFFTQLFFSYELSSSWKWNLFNFRTKSSIANNQIDSNSQSNTTSNNLTPTEWHEYLERTIWDKGNIPDDLPKDKIDRVKHLIAMAQSQGFLDTEISKTHKILTPLHSCASSHSCNSITKNKSNAPYEIAELLLKAGADPNAANDGSWGHPPLMFALGHGDNSTSFIALLLAHGANVNYINQGGHTPLSFSSCNGITPEQTNALIQAGGVATTDKEQYSYCKINSKKARLIAFLKQHDENFNDTDYQPINLNKNHITPDQLRTICSYDNTFEITENDRANYKKVLKIHSHKQA